MIVDDEAEFRNALLQSLAGTEFRGLGVAGATEALLAVKKSHPRTILLDWALAGSISGLAILKALKADPSTRHIPVIMISGLTRSAADKLAVQRAGAEGFFAKFDLMNRRETFLESLRAAVAKNKAPSTWRLLVVEDDPGVQEFIRFALARREFDVHFASTGREGCRLARELNPNLVLLDMGLPDINGIEVCKLLREDDETRGIPILAMSAMDRTAGVLESAFKALGIEDYIPKPFGENELLKHMSKLLGQNPSERVSGEIIVRGRIRLDVKGRRVWVGGHPIKRIGHKQFELLHHLIKSADGVTRATLLSLIWSGAENSNVADVTVHRLRRLLGFAEAEGIISIPGGYKLVG